MNVNSINLDRQTSI